MEGCKIKNRKSAEELLEKLNLPSVNELLVKRLKIMGMPMDIIKLIREWLTGRSYYVQLSYRIKGLILKNYIVIMIRPK